MRTLCPPVAFSTGRAAPSQSCTLTDASQLGAECLVQARLRSAGFRKSTASRHWLFQQRNHEMALLLVSFGRTALET
jgi:hypothetical protein